MGDAERVDRRARILLAGGILLGGIAAASLFRRPCPSSDPPAAEAGRTERRQPGESLRPEAAAAGMPAARIESAVAAPSRFQSPPPSAAAAAPAQADGLVPALPRSYPRPNAASTARWGASMAAPRPAATRLGESVRAHRIVDGDTLASLAGRYLGDAARAGEIFEANRDVLPSPEALPIGAILRIPPRCPQPVRP